MEEINQSEITFNIRSGWPNMLQNDLFYFNISISQMSQVSGLSKYRIGRIARETKYHEELFDELSILTDSLNKIVNERIKVQPKETIEL